MCELLFQHGTLPILIIIAPSAFQVVRTVSAGYRHSAAVTEDGELYTWGEGDLLLWDNLQVLHRAGGGFGDHPRLLLRTQTVYSP